MCGIAGMVGKNVGLYASETVAGMLVSLARRGPDAEGLHVWPDAVFGHRRLAILDLSEAGRQPMLSNDGRIGVVFNGCVYNFLMLRQELEALGFTFRSNCDTEVLIQGYRAWGIDGLVERARGMFAFALWDEDERRLFLVRDRLGVKPLIYAERDGVLAFASTVTALRVAGFGDEIDPDAVLEFLEFGYVTAARAIYRGLHKLPAAAILEWKDGRTSQRSYWTLPQADPDSRVTFEDAVAETERLLLEAVRIRLYADVPIGALLSGGVDSTLICWAMSRLNANVRAFTIATPGDPADESADAAATARQLGIDHEVIELAQDEQPEFSDLTDAYGEPFACSSALGMLRVSRAIKRHATVMLTGDGGDDVFLGYPFHRRFWLAQRFANYLPAPAAKLWPRIRPAGAQMAPIRRARHFIDYATGGLGAVARVHDGLPWYERHNILGAKLNGSELEQRNIELSMTSARRLLNDVLQYDYRTQFTGEFMTKVDGGAMYYAVEARSPLLDHVIWEFAGALPFGIRLHGGELKAILREIVRRRVSPDVARRRKRGFTVPVERWLSGRWKQHLHELANGSILGKEEWVRMDELRAAVYSTNNGMTAPVQLWNLVVLEHWMRSQKQPRLSKPAVVPQFS